MIDVLLQTLPFFALIGLGFGAAARGFFPPEATAYLTRFVFYFALSAMLFRFSALTFNTHRIHYDLPYARDVERYRGLVVHGPLMASMLLQMAARELGENKLNTFSFRAVSPAIAGEPLHLAMRQGSNGLELGTFAADGRQCVKAGATTS